MRSLSWGILFVLLLLTPFMRQSVSVTPEETTLSPLNPLILTVIAGLIVSIIGSISSAAVAIITALRVSAVKEQASATASTLLTVAKDTEAIKGHVNSEKTAAEGRERALVQENVLLREIISDKRATAALLAQAGASKPYVVHTPAAAAPVTDAPAAAVVSSLENIDANTAAIEANTARTDAAVHEDIKKREEEA